MTDLSRRSALGLSAAALAVAPAAAQTPKVLGVDAPHPALDKPLTRIAFGSCAKQDKDQPIWEAIFATKPDLFMFLGDNIYADTRDPKVMAAKYAMLAAKPHFRRLRDEIPVVAIWDDHDFGENDAGGDYPMKAESRRQFCDFWGEPENSPRRTRDGVHAAYVFGPEGRRVQILLPDLRWNRTPLAEKTFKGGYKAWAVARGLQGKETPGPYDRIADQDATMIGEPQWAWLEAQLAQPADLRIFGSSLQVLADFAGWESWINYARDHQRLFEAIRRQRAERLFFVSGDTHYAEVSRLDLNVPYPMWDVTSSGLTEVWPVTPPNALRASAVLRERNFGLITIDWSPSAPKVTVEIRDEKGQVRISQAIDAGTLRMG
ncbi:phosphodiesterase [Caulobacter zeae]|uniref:Phosphodiesterase n=1 Tax=Caulobacter zeae TaxID=2055137 RepID=A0A2N5DQX5_9CAUL|nr:alkaline phosphatase D family protein [Caulobacter zeae]PLR28468.1 phosphodiesterase [Caulobacter zeae]